MNATRVLVLPLILLQSACAGDVPEAADGSPLVLRGEPDCAECEITLLRIAELGHPADPTSVQASAAEHGCMVAPVYDGTFLISGVVGGGQVQTYARDGRAVSSIGRRGEGPAEFGSNLLLTTAGDTVFVVDNSNARITMWDLDGGVLGSFRLPMRVNAFARLDDGRFLVHRRPGGPEQPLFRLLDPTGAEVASLGRTEREQWDTDQWVVAPGQSAPFWAASMWEYRLFRGWEDSLATAVVREVDWFPPDARWSREILETEPPPPLISHLHETDDGMMWVFVAVADPDWAPGIPDVGSAQWRRDSFDTMIEVIDLDEGEVLASYRSDDFLGGICGRRLVYAVTPSAGGHVTATVFEPRLRREEALSDLGGR